MKPDVVSPQPSDLHAADPVESIDKGVSSASLADVIDRLAARRGTLIEAGRASRHYWRDIWHYRELLYLLAWRDVSVRYRQTVLGVIWAIIQPVAAMIVLVFAFGKVAGLPSDGVPYPVLVYAGMLPWQFFASALTNSSNSLVANANLLTKVYFPRLIIPAASIAVCLVDFAVSAVIMTVLMVIYGYTPSGYIVLLPLLMIMLCAVAYGLGLIMATWNVRYRDFRYVVPFLIQFGLFLSPVGFSTSVIPEEWRLLYSLNPMAGIIDGFRLAILGQGSGLDPAGFAVSCVLTIFLLVLGLVGFRRMEREFADVI